MSRRSYFRTLLHSQRVCASKMLLRAARQHFYLVLRSSWDTSRLKMSLLFRSEILTLLVNALTADAKFFGHNRQKFLKPIEMILSTKPKTFFFQSLIAFLKLGSHFEHFFKKIEASVLTYLQYYWLLKTCLL